MRARHLAPILVLLLLAGCTRSSTPEGRSPVFVGGTPPPTTNPAPSVTPSPQVCPNDLFKELDRNDVAGTAHALVPGDPVILVVCGSKTRVEITSSVEVRRYVVMLNQLQRVPPGGIYNCPADLGPTYGLFFDYPGGDVLAFTVDASGCRFVSNGSSSSWATETLLHRLTTLLNRR